MTPAPSHLIGWVVLKGLNESGDQLEAAVRCPCGSGHLEFHSAGPPLAPAIRLSFHCVVRATCVICGQSRTLFDNALHGWDALCRPSAQQTLHPTSLEPVRCPKCNAAEHRGTVLLKIMADERRLFLFSGGSLDESRRFDAFTAIDVGIECCACGHSLPDWERFETSAAGLPTSNQAYYRPFTMELTVLWDGERVGRIHVTARHVRWPELVGDFFPDPNWEGEGPTPQNIFVSPLALECSRCGRVSELIDTRRHGYDGEQGGDCNMTAEGPRARFPCPQCGEAPFAVIRGFSYGGHDYDPLDPDARPQDFFGGFSLSGECSLCGRLVHVTGFECA
jgi:hypothetical protein